MNTTIFDITKTKSNFDITFHDVICNPIADGVYKLPWNTRDSIKVLIHKLRTLKLHDSDVFAKGSKSNAQNLLVDVKHIYKDNLYDCFRSIIDQDQITGNYDTCKIVDGCIWFNK